MIPGIDVSHWQGVIDWQEVKRSGVKFAFIKATEFPDRKTTLFIDEHYKANIEGARQNGIHWGVYHFFRTHIDPVIQAQVFCETVGTFDSLPPVLDLEVAGCKGSKLNSKISSFLKETERLTNRKPIIYTSGGFWRPYMTYEKRTDTDWASEYPLWIAQYTTTWPSLCYPWVGWDFWQFTDKGKIPGIKAHVDINWFNGSLKVLQERFLPSNVENVEYEVDEVEYQTSGEPLSEISSQPSVELPSAPPSQPSSALPSQSLNQPPIKPSSDFSSESEKDQKPPFSFMDFLKLLFSLKNKKSPAPEKQNMIPVEDWVREYFFVDSNREKN
jgi:GH25 family lysozyme M1 (1,4-beta-N-acetylmuramidase)